MLEGGRGLNQAATFRSPRKTFFYWRNIHLKKEQAESAPRAIRVSKMSRSKKIFGKNLKESLTLP